MNQFILISITIYIITFILLYIDKEIKTEVLKSNIFEIKQDKFMNILFLSLIAPYTLYTLIKIKQKKMKSLKTILIILSIIFSIYMLLNLTSKLINFSNTEIEYKNKYEQLILQRKSLFDKIYSEIPLLANVAIHNDSMFIKVVELQMAGRKDGENLTWKWLQEQNPTASYSEVSSFYKEISNVILFNKDIFYKNEIEMQKLVYSHKNLITKFPGSLYNNFFNRNLIIYKPILVLQDSNSINKIF